MSPQDRELLTSLCTLLSDAVKCAGGWKKVNNRLASRLARLCGASKLRRLCLYSFRGTACARYKDAGLSPTEIAALMGHAVDTTAFRHYPQARQVRGKWRQKIAYRPDPRCVATVRNPYRDPALLRAKLESAKNVRKNDQNLTSNELAVIAHQPNFVQRANPTIDLLENDQVTLPFIRQ